MFAGVDDDCNNNGTPDTCDIFDGTSLDDDGDGVPDECVDCTGDLTGDGVVNTVDLLDLLAAWGTPDGDIDGDGTTNTVDFLALLSAWGPC